MGDAVGVIGIGALGAALAEDLAKQGARVFAYDVRSGYRVPKGAVKCRCLKDLLLCSDTVFGCTGDDVIDIGLLDGLERKPITFISCSSRDVEFRSLLRYYGMSSAIYGKTNIKTPTGTHYVENGGFPINFDRVQELESADEIALTRALVLAGVLQAQRLDCSRPHSDVTMLSPTAQQHIVRSWMEARKSSPNRFGVSNQSFNNPRWWETNSYGIPTGRREQTKLLGKAIDYFGRLRNRFLASGLSSKKPDSRLY